jgi:site-specific DNA-cytosine methylase
MATQTSQQETALLSTGALMVAAGNTFERPGSDCRTRALDEPLWTQHATNGVGVITPPLALAIDNYQGAPRSPAAPLPTQPASETLALVSAGVVPYRANTIPASHAEPMATFTAEQIPAVVTAAGFIKNNGSIDEATYRAHPVTIPLGAQVGSANSVGLLFGGWVKHNGGPTSTAPHALTEPFGTITTHHPNTSILTALWRDSLKDLLLEDCYFRMMFSHEVGVGCGFQVDHPMLGPGDFIVWGSTRDQVDGFGNAVSPQVGEWIGHRLREVL